MQKPSCLDVWDLVHACKTSHRRKRKSKIKAFVYVTWYALIYVPTLTINSYHLVYSAVLPPCLDFILCISKKVEFAEEKDTWLGRNLEDVYSQFTIKLDFSLLNNGNWWWYIECPQGPNIVFFYEGCSKMLYILVFLLHESLSIALQCFFIQNCYP